MKNIKIKNIGMKSDDEKNEIRNLQSIFICWNDGVIGKIYKADEKNKVKSKT